MGLGFAGWLIAAAVATEASPSDQPRRSADPRPLPAPTELAGEVAPRTAERAIIFLNFDGATLTAGTDDARSNSTVLTELAGDFPAYGDASNRAAALQAVKADFAAYDAIIVDNRPTSGNYTMAMVGPHEAGQVLGIAPLDCRDRFPNNIVFAFHGAGDGYGAAAQANTISQEVAHSFGLEHVDRVGDIMYPVSAGGDPAFLDECLTIVGSPEVMCSDQHEDHCGPNLQNSHRELLQRFGPATPVDPSEVLLEITAPGDGDELDVGAPFTIVAQSIDGRSFANVVLFVNESNVGGRTTQPYAWDVAGLEQGVYELHVIGVEASGAMSRSETIELYVGAENPERDETGGCAIATDRGTEATPELRRVPWLVVLVCLGRRRRDGCCARPVAPTSGR